MKDARQFIIGKFPTDWKLCDGGHVVHWPDKMSPSDLQRQTFQAMTNFYSKQKATKMLLKGQWKNFRIRLAGSMIVRKWEVQNREYLAKLNEIQMTS